jgi:molybdate transport system substrate-binding protein
MLTISTVVRPRATAAALALAALAVMSPAEAQSEAPRLQVLLSGGFNAAYQMLQPAYQQSTGLTINTGLGQSVGGTPTAIPDRLANGEPADLVIMARDRRRGCAALDQVQYRSIWR